MFSKPSAISGFISSTSDTSSFTLVFWISGTISGFFIGLPKNLSSFCSVQSVLTNSLACTVLFVEAFSLSVSLAGSVFTIGSLALKRYTRLFIYHY